VGAARDAGHAQYRRPGGSRASLCEMRSVATRIGAEPLADTLERLAGRTRLDLVPPAVSRGRPRPAGFLADLSAANLSPRACTAPLRHGILPVMPSLGPEPG